MSGTILTMTRTPPADYKAALSRRGFALGEWIGGGAYGSVYRADQVSLSRLVAVKFYDNRFTRGPANEKRFRREAQLLARVQHPAVPFVITTGVIEREGGGVPYTVMEHVPGRPLRRRLELGPPMSAQEVFALMRDVLSALSAAHAQGVIHRDVKPENILLSNPGTYLIDFSIGVCLSAGRGVTRATRTGEALGTCEYAAPEQLRDASAVDHRADVFSAGVVLAEMLGARAPIRLDRLAAEIPAVAANLRAVIGRACEADPDARFQSADEFLARLDAVMGPRTMGMFDPKVVICPNMKCSGATRSTGGTYLFGPKITGPTTDQYCANCGSEYIRGCPSCHLPLPGNIAALISKQAKSDPDALEAHCARCGREIFVTPSCQKCRSYLTAEEIDKDTAAGCSKCKRRSAGSWAYGSAGSADDIPF